MQKQRNGDAETRPDESACQHVRRPMRICRDAQEPRPERQRTTAAGDERCQSVAAQKSERRSGGGKAESPCRIARKEGKVALHEVSAPFGVVLLTVIKSRAPPPHGFLGAVGNARRQKERVEHDPRILKRVAPLPLGKGGHEQRRERGHRHHSRREDVAHGGGGFTRTLVQYQRVAERFVETRRIAPATGFGRIPRGDAVGREDRHRADRLQREKAGSGVLQRS